MTLSTEQLIGELSAGLPPVRRLPSPGRRALLWLALVGLGAVVLATTTDLREPAARLASAPDMWLSAAGSVATAILAAISACVLSVPGYSRRWAWLPLPAAALWLLASGFGCLRGTVLATLHPASLHEAMANCMPFILTTSAALAIPLGLLLAWARPLRPGLVAVEGGLAVAGASASLLWFIHPFDASLEDLVVHLAAVLAVIGACRLLALIPLADRRSHRAA